MFKTVHNIAKKIFSVTDLLAGACFFALVILILANILMRNIFGQPITGTFEMVGLLTATGLGLALAHCEMNDGNIAMSIVTDKLPRRAQKVVDIVICLIALSFWLVVVWRIFIYANTSFINGRVTSTSEIPIYPFIIVLGVNVFCLCVAVAFKFTLSIKDAIASFRKPAPGEAGK